MSSPSGAESLPVISMRRLESGRAADAMAVAREIRAVCETVGFFYVRDHGVPPETIESARSACLEFYRRPLEEKLRAGVNEKHRGFVPMGQTVLSDGALTDHKESFTMGLDLLCDDPDVVAGRPLMGPNVFPHDMPHMRDAMVAYRDAVAACATRLLRAIAFALSLPADFFEAMYDKPLVRLSANYYPPLPPDAPPNQFGTSPHTDYGVITLLWAGRPRRPRAQTPFGQMGPRPAEPRHLRGQHRRSSRAVDKRPFRLDCAPGSKSLRPRTSLARLLLRSPPGHRGRVHRIVPRAGYRAALSGHDVRGVHSITIRRGVRISQVGPHRRPSAARLTFSAVVLRCAPPRYRVTAR